MSAYRCRRKCDKCQISVYCIGPLGESVQRARQRINHECPESDSLSRMTELPYRPMYKDLDEQVSVIVAFSKGEMRPYRFYWKDRAFKITRVTGTWKAPQGETWMKHFSVVDASDNVFFLTYEERNMRWAISKVWVE